MRSNQRQHRRETLYPILPLPLESPISEHSFRKYWKNSGKAFPDELQQSLRSSTIPLLSPYGKKSISERRCPEEHCDKRGRYSRERVRTAYEKGNPGVHRPLVGETARRNENSSR